MDQIISSFCIINWTAFGNSFPKVNDTETKIERNSATSVEKMRALQGGG